MCQHFSLDKSISLIYDKTMARERPANPITSEALAMFIVGLREGYRFHLLEVFSWGFNSPQVQHNALPIAGNYPQGTSSGRSRKDGVSRPAVILAQVLKKGNSQNDVP